MENKRKYLPKFNTWDIVEVENLPEYMSHFPKWQAIVMRSFQQKFLWVNKELEEIIPQYTLLFPHWESSRYKEWILKLVKKCKWISYKGKGSFLY